MIAVSELTRRIVIGKYGIPADKVVTVHNAVRFGESEEDAPERAVKDKVVAFLGRITYQKGDVYKRQLSHYPGELGIDWAQFIGLGRVDPEDPNEKFSMSVLACNLLMNW